MPFTSKAQQGFMFANHPKIAKRWAKETPKKGPHALKNLPYHKMASALGYKGMKG